MRLSRPPYASRAPPRRGTSSPFLSVSITIRRAPHALRPPPWNGMREANRLKLALQGVHPKKISKTPTMGRPFLHATNGCVPRPEARRRHQYGGVARDDVRDQVRDR